MWMSKREFENLQEYYDIVEKLMKRFLTMIKRYQVLEEKYNLILRALNDLYDKYNLTRKLEKFNADMIILNTNSFNTAAKQIAQDIILS